MSITGGTTIPHVLETLVLTPLNRPDLLPSLLPIILGAVVVELYFGKYTSEELGWNTSLGNAVIWVATGGTLLLNGAMETIESYAAYFLIAAGGLVGYLNFFHKWSSEMAFFFSSHGLVYSIAYITVVYVRRDIPINSTSLKAAAVFIIGVNIVFKFLQQMETSRDRGPDLDLQ